MTDLLELLIYESFKACGKDDRNAAKLAAESVRKALPRVDREAELVERDRRIYELRTAPGRPLTEAQLAERFNLAPRSIRRIVAEQHALNRRIA